MACEAHLPQEPPRTRIFTLIRHRKGIRVRMRSQGHELAWCSSFVVGLVGLCFLLRFPGKGGEGCLVTSDY